MKNKRTYHIPLTFLLALLMVFQSCTVYKKQAVSLEEAVQARKKTRITMADGTVKKYSYITYRDEQYFGVKPAESASKNMIDEVLPSNAVSTVKIKDLKASNRRSVILAGAPAVGLLAFGFWYFSTGDWVDCLYNCD
ncbi:hypothetical protein [Robiginitalea sp. IMCC43444]|uniref:hypothetical protein n=1 Tax=Robiginitalea sp. IMCC43444 TaxID=3459121 RepID=UPI004043067E